MVLAQVEPPPTGWTASAEVVLKHAEAQPNTTFALLAIVGPVLVGFAFIFAAVKWGLPFVEKQLIAFREHTAALLNQRGADASQDLAAARELAKEQHASIVDKIGSEVYRHTGELAKLNEKSDRHGEMLRSIAAVVGKVAVVIALVLLGAGAAHKVHRLAIAAPACKCDPPCASGQRCTCSGCKEIKTTTTGVPHSALAVNGFANLANYSCTATSNACF